MLASSIEDTVRRIPLFQNQQFLLQAARGGIINHVYKLAWNGKRFFVKYSCSPAEMRLRERPRDFLALMSADRLQNEVRAMRISKTALPSGSVPEILWFDRKARIVLLSDLAGPDGVMLDTVFPQRIDKPITLQLAQIASCIAGLRGQENRIRSAKRENRARAIKLKYSFLLPVRNLVGSEISRTAVDAFYEHSIRQDVALSHGDFHARNIVVKKDGTVGILDFEEAMLHDPVYDIAILTSSYVLWALRSPGISRLAKNLIEILIEEFLKATGIDRHTAYFALNNYLAGVMMDRVVGIGLADWPRTDTDKARVRYIALRVLSRASEPTAELIDDAL